MCLSFNLASNNYTFIDNASCMAKRYMSFESQRDALYIGMISIYAWIVPNMTQISPVAHLNHISNLPVNVRHDTSWQVVSFLVLLHCFWVTKEKVKDKGQGQIFPKMGKKTKELVISRKLRNWSVLKNLKFYMCEGEELILLFS